MPMPHVLVPVGLPRDTVSTLRRRGRPAVDRAASDARATGEALSLLWITADRGAESHDDGTAPSAAALGRVLRLAIDASGALAADDEGCFVVVLGRADIAAAGEAAEALRDIVERHFGAGRPLTHSLTHSLTRSVTRSVTRSLTRSLTISVGVACSPPNTDWTADELLALARARCAGASAAGGNRVRADGPGPAAMRRLARWPAWRADDPASAGVAQLRLF